MFKYHLTRNVIILTAFGLSALTISCSTKKEKGKSETRAISTLSNENNQHYWLFVGTYTSKERNGQAEGLYWYEMDTATKKTELVDVYKDIVNPSYLTISPDEKHIYAVSQTNGDSLARHGQVYALRINASSRKLEFINKQSSEGGYPCHISTDHGGNIAMAANYGTGNIAIFPINKDGSLGPATSVILTNVKNHNWESVSYQFRFLLVLCQI